jgi:type I restriction enzyme S subunit
VKPGLSRSEAHQLPVVVPPLAEQHRIVAKVDELMALCDELEVTQAKREKRRHRLVASTLHGLNNGDASPDSDSSSATFEENARFYFNHLPRLTTRPEHIQQLRQTILNLAVRGKLVPQNPKDEPASALIERIRQERLGTVKEYRIRSERQLNGRGKASAPFALPHGWSWTRFPDLGTFGRGKSKHRPRNDASLFEGGTHLFVQTGDVARSRGVIETFTDKYNDIGLAQSAKWPKGTLCITIAANIADSGILSFDACFPDSVVGFIPAPIFPNSRYFEYFIRTVKAGLLEYAPSTAQKNINIGILNEVLIPLPPLAEQHRIVARVDELMALCGELESQISNTTATRRQLLEATLQDALSALHEHHYPT